MMNGRAKLVLVVLALAAALQAGAQATPDAFLLKIGTTEDLDSLSPFTAYERAATELFLLVYDPLVAFDADLKPTPALAESWTVSPDGLEWTFRLRRGVKWSDGKPFTSGDVKFTYEAIMESGLGLYGSFLEGITEILTPDKHTVVLRTEAPKANILQNPTPILPRHVWEPGAATLETFVDPAMVGTGPFRLREWRKGEYLSLKANPDYFGTKPRAAGIVFTIFASRDTLARSLAAGEINVALNLYPDQAAILEKEANVSVFRFSANGFTQLSANSWENPASKGHPALRDARVRQAMEFAMDKKEILAVAMGGAGTVGSTLIPESTPEWHLALPAAELRGYDPAAAKALLEKAGYVDRNRDGVLEDAAGRALDFRFLLRADNIREVKAGQMIQAYLQAVGIATRISTVDDGVLQDAIDTADYDLFIWGWGGDVDPTTILAILTTGQIGSLNEPRWSNPAYDEAVRRQATILDPKERRVVVEQAQRLAYEGAPYIILFYDGDVQAVRNDMVIGLAQVSGGPLFYANTNVNYIRAAPAAAAEAPARRRPALIAAAVAFAAAAAALAFRLRRKA